MNSNKYKDNIYELRYITDLKDMVDSSARLFPDHVAYYVKDVRGGEYRPIMYPEVKADIDALGTKLIDLGLKDEKIAVIGENSYEWIISYLAVTNGCGVAVPLDRELPSDEIINLMTRAGVKAIIYSKKMKGVVTEALENFEDKKISICMDPKEEEEGVYALKDLIAEGKEMIAGGNDTFVNAKIDREAMCALLFTSGTTGLAKGVMLSHKNISANVYNMSKYIKIREDGIGLSVLPMHHTYELTCHIFTSFYQGIAVAICEGLKYIQKNMKEIHATVMLGVPLVFESMHKKIFKQADASGNGRKLRAMIALSKRLKLYNNQTLIRKLFKQIHNSTGGEMTQFISGGAAIDPHVIEDFEAMGIPMIQGYGMTENAPIIAVNRDCCSRADAAGFVMPGTEVKIIEPDNKGVGEVICRGPSVMIGYYNDPVMTDQVLKDGWLYTGDLGYMDREGYLYICGRKKNVIVTKNGKNIFPEEVEYYLQSSPYIAEALVHGVKDETTGDTIVKAEIFPDYETIQEQIGDMSESGWKQFFKETIDDINDRMPLYKRVKRYNIRETEFSKTTTRKIKRHTAANYSDEDSQNL